MTSAKDICLDILSKSDVSLDDFIVHDERLWDRIVSQRTLGIAEAYMDGWWDYKDIDDLVARVHSSNALSTLRPNIKIIAAALKAKLSNQQTKKKSINNAKHHYDIGNDLYSRMLDETMAYSCGYWQHDYDDLHLAQICKFDLICQKLELEPGMKVLDLGCGWGGFLEFAANKYGIIGVGITPAMTQYEEATNRVKDLPVTILNTDYRDVVGKYDRIVSIGMFEHVGHKNYKTFFDKCNDLLDTDGMMLHHTIGALRSKSYTDKFITRYIFPGGQLPSLAQFTKAAEPKWVIEDVHNIGQHYDKTLMAWYKNINGSWQEIPRYDERFQRMWNFYLLSCAGSFRARELQLWQVVMRRKGFASEYESVR